MGINTPSELTADLQIGATDQGMVRLFIFVNDGEMEIPLDFSPEDAMEIAEELQAAAKQAEKI